MLKRVCCPLDCFDSCSILAEVKENKVIRLNGDKDHPITQGFLCKKGYRLLEKVYSRERIKKPLVRVKNDFHEIEWDQALDIIADRIDETIKKYNSSAILYYSGDGYEGYVKNIERLFFDFLGGATYSKGSLCWGAGLLAQKADFGNSLCHSPFDLFNSNWIVLWGRNALWTNIHLYYMILKAKKQGKKVLVIDVYESPTFKIADLGITITPSSDSYLAYGAIKYIIENQKEDKDFIQNHTIGFDEVKKIVENLSYEEIERKCGISKDTIEKVAQIYLQKPVSTFIGYGPQRYLNGVNTIRTIDYLVAISGNIGISGGGANYAHRFNIEMKELFKDEKRSVNKRFFVRAKFGEFLKNIDNPPVEVIYISGGNPVSQCPDSDLVFNELRKRFVVNVDMFLTSTSYASSVVLPVASFLEKDDIFIPNMWHDYIMVSERAIDKLYGTKSEVEIINELSKRLNLDFPIKTEKEWVEELKSLLSNELKINFDNCYVRGSQIDIAWQDKVFMTKSKMFEFKNEKFGVALPLSEDFKGLKNQLRLVTIHSDKALHSQEFCELKPVAYLSSSDAKRLQLEDKDKALIYNGCGGLIVEIQISDNVKSGMIIMEEGYQNKEADAINSCLFPITSEYDAQAAFNSNYVFIKKVTQ